jgi:hypothetical protein
MLEACHKAPKSDMDPATANFEPAILDVSATMASIQLLIQIDNTWMPALSISVAECNHFSLRLLKWLRFLGYAIYGRIGDIYTHLGGRPVNYQLAVNAGARYFFISEGKIHVSVRFLLILYCKMNLDLWTLAA